MTLTIDDLVKFASKDETRFNINRPWSDGGYSYATTGHILIRVPRMEGIPENENVPKPIDKMFPSKEPTVWLPIIGMELPPSKEEKCPICKGKGKYYRETCFECNGEKTFRVPVPVPVGESHFDIHYLSLLAALPNCRIAPDGIGQALFRFDGGDGLLMPMNVPPEAP